MRSLVTEPAWRTAPVQTASFGLLVRHVLKRATIVIRIDVHRPKPGQLVLVAPDVHRARRLLPAPLCGPERPHASHVRASFRFTRLLPTATPTRPADRSLPPRWRSPHDC